MSWHTCVSALNLMALKRRVGRSEAETHHSFSGSHAPAWEQIFDAPASRGQKLDAGASRMGSHSGESMPLS
ncbi:hypothetical protein QUF54_06310 [Candidatus Marithioploca araucensis]|uniref:Uncharacterized protein n=1 Tax=Candidatus Marithioploca araucensis TaxID=70273 RepID=A0ABT7VTS1_9GAMM|nr:hypothetical protein [Candidatus Marithioploca araucensis]